jgi:UrcA family protein
MFTHTIIRTVVGAAGAALFSAVCLTAAAAPAAAATLVSVSKAVSYADLDLDSAKDRAILDSRIKSAARSICYDDSNELKNRIAASRCFRDAVSHAARP